MKNPQYPALIVLLGALAACTSSSVLRQQSLIKATPLVGAEKHSAKAEQVVSKALSLTGVPYRAYGSSPKSGFDCSGLVTYVYQSVGIRLPRATRDLMNMRVPRVKPAQLRAGDLLYFATRRYNRAVSHVGIYIGDGVFIHAPSSGKSVGKASLSDKYWQSNYLGANRPLQ